VRLNTLSLENDGGIAVLTIQRPEAMNALNFTVLNDLAELFMGLKKTPPRALIVTGAGEKSFVAGADIKEMESMSSRQAEEFATRGQELFSQLEAFPFATIAAVNGFALGGGLELAIACDWIVASTKAKWGLPEVSLGLIPGYGGTQRLSRSIGKSLAKRIALSGEIFSAEQGYQWGLFASVVEPEQVLPTAKKQAELVATRAPIAVALAKRYLETGFDQELSAGLKIEKRLFGEVFESKDHNEGIQAFIAKRPPQFKGE
jgi:enoyl-CoA hydratase